MKRKVERVRVGDLKNESATVFYGSDPNISNPLPEYLTTSNRYDFEIVWVVFFTEKNPYLKPRPPLPQKMPGCLSGLINSLESDWF